MRGWDEAELLSSFIMSRTSLIVTNLSLLISACSRIYCLVVSTQVAPGVDMTWHVITSIPWW